MTDTVTMYLSLSAMRKNEGIRILVQTVDGASEEAIDNTIEEAKQINGKAICIVLDTIKGHGQHYEDMPDNHPLKYLKKDAP